MLIVNQKYKPWVLFSAFLSLLFTMPFQSEAQFTVNEPFTGSTTSNDVIIGGSPSAYLTSGQEDPDNEGWLRLTEDAGNKRGYVYINQSFPTNQGVLVEFEYKTWRSQDNTYHGADGIGVFLFDGQYGPDGGEDGYHTFSLGGYGGSLGYAPISGTTNHGLKGGYIGLGIDEYGNYSNPTEGRNGGPGFTPNAIVLRGPTTSNSNTTNKYWAGTTSMGNNTSGVLDYDNVTATRPTDAQFYRRVRIEIIPVEDNDGNNQYQITVRWKTTPQGSFDSLFSYTTTTPPPPTLKIGFAASTGGGYNIHEIRHLIITTPGGVRVVKSEDKANLNIGDQVSYNVTLYNDSKTQLDSLQWADTLRDGNGNIVNMPGTFNVTNIEFNNNGYAANSQVLSPSFNANILTGKVSMAPNSTVTYTITGTINKKPAGGILYNKAAVFPLSTGLTDADPTNDTSSVIAHVGVPVSGTVFNDNNGGTPDGDAYPGAIVHLLDANGNTVATTTTTADGSYRFNYLDDGNYTVQIETPDGFIITGNTDGNTNDTVTVHINGSDAGSNNYSTAVTNIDFGINQGPTAMDDIADHQVPRNPVTLNVTNNDTDKNNGMVIPSTLQLIVPVNAPAGSVCDDTDGDGNCDRITVPGEGVWQADATGNVTFTPQSGFTTDPTPVQYTVKDNAGIESNTATITISYDQVLPVSLTGFNVLVNNCRVLLQWTTATEENFSLFEIERSTDTRNYSGIATVAAKGNNSTYSYADNNAATGTNYYRLKMTDINGDYTYSKVIKISYDCNNRPIALYPNPVSDKLVITGLKGGESILVINTIGQRVAEVNAKASECLVDMQQLASGMYYVIITDASGSLLTNQQVIKK